MKTFANGGENKKNLDHWKNKKLVSGVLWIDDLKQWFFFSKNKYSGGNEKKYIKIRPFVNFRNKTQIKHGEKMVSTSEDYENGNFFFFYPAHAYTENLCLIELQKVVIDSFWFPTRLLLFNTKRCPGQWLPREFHTKKFCSFPRLTRFISGKTGGGFLSGQFQRSSPF